MSDEKPRRMMGHGTIPGLDTCYHCHEHDEKKSCHSKAFGGLCQPVESPAPPEPQAASSHSPVHMMAQPYGIDMTAIPLQHRGQHARWTTCNDIGCERMGIALASLADLNLMRSCPTKTYHKTHRYCPSCPWREDYNESTTTPEPQAKAAAPSLADERLEPLSEGEADFLRVGDVAMIGGGRLILVTDPGEVRCGKIYGIWRPFAAARKASNET